MEKREGRKEVQKGGKGRMEKQERVKDLIRNRKKRIKEQMWE